MTSIARHVLILLSVVLFTGCAANQLHGYQNTYYAYNVPQPLFDRAANKLQEHGLINARIARDNVGRVQLKGTYQNEDEVDRAFVIVQSIVGLKSTSPFYPESVKEKRWEVEAGRALEAYTKAANAARSNVIGERRALIIGINDFPNLGATASIQGQDDAEVVMRAAQKVGYKVTALLGSEATKAKIEATLSKMKREITPNDVLFIYISSHGTTPVPSPYGIADRKMSIVAVDSSGSKAGRKPKDKVEHELNLQESSVADTKVQELGNMPTRSTRIVIDTCYSGEILKGVPDAYAAAGDKESRLYIEKTNGGQPERAGVTVSTWIPAASKAIRFSSDASPAAARARPQGSSKSTAMDFSSRFTIITATSDGEESLGPDIKRGVRDFDSPVTPGKRLRGSFFTQSFFEYLGHYNGQLEPAFRDAKQFTQSHVARISHRLKTQVPRLEPPLPAADLSNLYK